MPRAGLTTAAVVEAALAVVDERGVGGLTLAAVAQRTGVATPSLYKHVAGLGELRTLLGARVIEDMTETFTRAVVGRSGEDAIAAFLHAYRGYVQAHPARYTAAPLDPLHDPALVSVGEKLLDVVFGALRAYDLDRSEAVHVTRCLRAVAHGFASLEAGGGFGLPENLDQTYDQLVRVVLGVVRREEG